MKEFLFFTICIIICCMFSTGVAMIFTGDSFEKFLGVIVCIYCVVRAIHYTKLYEDSI